MVKSPRFAINSCKTRSGTNNKTTIMKESSWLKLVLAGLVLLAITTIPALAQDAPVKKPKPPAPPPPPIGSQLTDNGR
jgi:hypothetical protein